MHVFDSDGVFIERWPDVPGGNDSVIDEDDAIHIATGHSGIQSRTLTGDLIGTWGESGDSAGQFRDAPNRIWIDSQGDFYVAEVNTQLAPNKFTCL